MTEYFDHVDDEDNIIGRVTRADAHDNFLRHRSVHILIQTTDGRILLHQVKRNKRAYQLHMSTSAAGHVTSGHSYEEAAQKELQEELGIATDLTRVGRFVQDNYPIENEFCTVFTGVHDGPYTNWEEEAESILLFTRSELDRLVVDQPQVFTPGFLSAYALLRDSERSA